MFRQCFYYQGPVSSGGPYCLLKFQNFLTHFLQVKISSGLHRSPEGLEGCWTREAAPAFVQRAVFGTVPKRSLVHSGRRVLTDRLWKGANIVNLRPRKSSLKRFAANWWSLPN